MKLALKVRRVQEGFAFMDLLANGSRITGNCGIGIRLAELPAFILRLDPQAVEIDREMVDEHTFHRLVSIKAVRFY